MWSWKLLNNLIIKIRSNFSKKNLLIPMYPSPNLRQFNSYFDKNGFDPDAKNYIFKIKRLTCDQYREFVYMIKQKFSTKKPDLRDDTQ